MRGWLLLSFVPCLLLAQEPVEEKSWWQKRHERPDIFYPHNIHLQVMEQGGDSCMLCHPFSANTLVDSKQLQAVNLIANEPLAAICHECHMAEVSAPYACDVCHNDPAKIWPEDHNTDYTHRHAEDARRDDGECRSCHLEAAFCSECHFQRMTLGRRVHNLGYINQHGLDARLDPAACGVCHNGFFCSDCHRGAR